MPSVTVIDSEQVEPRCNPDTGLAVRRTLGRQTGFEALEQTVLEFEPGTSDAN